MFSVTRAVAVAATAFAATALPLVAAAPAQADTNLCLDYLADRGYDVDPIVMNACGTGASSFQDNELCADRLIDHGVWPRHAARACELATW
ncbi:hypothetical protein L6E12_33215 [Actinokineospora sp. PR83]|uniref:hypothetical protein n=1 Tax=Actinokineospora sp. PR83 TaxID=2884908 RepID=UPI001F229867|nr:hypothetical protein [Actinokineospora sp. PR83]MCG8920634.1 hypothetical protein [Actinokineospora sp. PR83]